MANVRLALTGLAIGAFLVAGPGSAQAETFEVNSAADSADRVAADARCDTKAKSGDQCTLRAAMEQANSLAGADEVTFRLKGRNRRGSAPGAARGPIGSAAAFKITPESELPPITDRLVIDGYTQPGAEPNDLASGLSTNLRVELDGSYLRGIGAAATGLQVTAPRVVVRGLVINEFFRGIELAAVRSRIEGNFIGTDVTGTQARGNNTNLAISQGSRNVVGGTNVADRNLISGSIYGGISIFGSPEAPARLNRIEGNYIGTARNGVSNLGNGAGSPAYDAIRMNGNSTRNSVGGTEPGAANVIAYSGRVGVNVSGDASTGNSILSNSIYGNGTQGINIAGDGVLSNDEDDVDSGGNLRQNHPVFSDTQTVAFIGTRVQGALNSTPDRAYLIQFFANPADEAVDEGRTLIGQTSVTTSADGDAVFDLVLDTDNLTGAHVTATATDPAGNTSEFSPGRQVDPAEQGRRDTRAGK